MDRREVEGLDELPLDQFAISRALFRGGTGRTIESDKSILTERTERSAP
jgi:hypothetical protein